MPCPWIGGERPSGLQSEMVLVIGPDDYDDEQHVRLVLDEYTLRMESVCVLIAGAGNEGVHRPSGFPMGKNYVGVHKFAYEWACYHWWGRWLHDKAWWGFVPKTKKEAARRNARALKGWSEAIMTRLMERGKAHAHVIAFWDQEKQHHADLMETARETVLLKNFKLVRVV